MLIAALGGDINPFYPDGEIPGVQKVLYTVISLSLSQTISMIRGEFIELYCVPQADSQLTHANVLIKTVITHIVFMVWSM